VAVMGLISFIWFSLVVIVLTHSYIRKRFLNIGHWVGRITGGVLMSFGLKTMVLLAKSL
jgi:threonine efflux protein